jgi:hypothetical protein
VDLDRSRRAFLKALEDPDHPVWVAIFEGPITASKRGVSIFDVWDRHPYGHDCSACRKWRKENEGMAAIEAGILARRAGRVGSCMWCDAPFDGAVHTDTDDARCFFPDLSVPDVGELAAA